MTTTQEWEHVLLPHREQAQLSRLISRFERAEVSPMQLAALLPDDAFLRASSWSELPSHVAVALAAEEVRARLAEFATEASAIRYRAVADDALSRSIVAIASDLGISRQAVSRMANQVYQSSLTERFHRLAGGRQ